MIFNNCYISEANVWSGSYIHGVDITQYKYLGFSFSVADMNFIQDGITSIIPVSGFMKTSINYALPILKDNYSPSDERSVYVCYDNKTSVRVYRGDSVFAYYRLSMYGFK